MTDESLVREVDEEVRLEQYQQLWKRYGNLSSAVSLVVIASVAGFKAWQYYDLKRSEAAAREYFAAAGARSGGQSRGGGERTAGGRLRQPRGYAVLARLQRAAELAKAGKIDEAVRTYDAVAAEAGVETAVRDVARIKAAYLLLELGHACRPHQARRSAQRRRVARGATWPGKSSPSHPTAIATLSPPTGS